MGQLIRESLLAPLNDLRLQLFKELVEQAPTEALIVALAVALWLCFMWGASLWGVVYGGVSRRWGPRRWLSFGGAVMLAPPALLSVCLVLLRELIERQGR